MTILSVSEARKRLPSLLSLVARGKGEVVITRHGKAVAKLVSCDADGTATVVPHPLRRLPLTIAPDFDVPLEGLWDALDG